MKQTAVEWLEDNGLCMCSKAMHVHLTEELNLISLITHTLC
jgi:hypothetical protein